MVGYGVGVVRNDSTRVKNSSGEKESSQCRPVKTIPPQPARARGRIAARQVHSLGDPQGLAQLVGHPFPQSPVITPLA